MSADIDISADMKGGHQSAASFISVEDLSFKIKINKKDMAILQNISFTQSAHRLCAILGASGSGKSTLLDIIGARKTIGSLSGRILVDGRSTIAGIGGHICAYVQQHDLHLPLLTVYETLWYSAWVRVSGDNTGN
jgi:ABC-type multidrug transport system ATPase subunit